MADYTARPGLGPLDQSTLLTRTAKRPSVVFGATASVLPKGEDPQRRVERPSLFEEACFCRVVKSNTVLAGRVPKQFPLASVGIQGSSTNAPLQMGLPRLWIFRVGNDGALGVISSVLKDVSL